MFTLLSTDGALTRGEIAERCGMSKVTVFDVTERLLGLGLIAKLGKKKDVSGPGPRAVLYGVCSGLGFGLGVEISAHSVAVEVRDASGSTLAHLTESRGEGEADAQLLIDTIGRVCGSVGLSPRDATATVIAAAGGIDPESGRPIAWELPNWRRNLGEDLAVHVGGTIELENEVNLRAIAEHTEGVCVHRDDFVYLALGSGIGAAIVHGGHLIRGRNGLSGELGYLPLGVTAFAPRTIESGDNDTPVELRTLLGGEAVLKLARAHSLDSPNAVDAVTRAAAAYGKATEATIFLDEFADRAALATGAILVVLDPECIVLGGDIGVAGGETLLELLRARVARVYGGLPVSAPELLSAGVTVAPIRAGISAMVHARLRNAILEATGYVTDSGGHISSVHPRPSHGDVSSAAPGSSS